MGNICGGDVKDETTDTALPGLPLDDIFSEISLEFPCYKKLSHCLAAKRISTILIEFHKFKNDPNSCTYKSMYEYIQQLGSYNNTKLLNDYIHLVNNHQTNEDYENVYNYFVSEMQTRCDAIDCNNLFRNQRDRSNDYNTNIRMQLYNTSETKETNTQQTIDKIHCYWLHTFDLGYRLTINERQTIINNNDNDHDNKNDNDDGIDKILLQRQKIVRSKRQRLTLIDTNNALSASDNKARPTILNNCNRNRINNNNKWILNKDTKMNKSRNKKQEAIYSFGFPYKYGESHQNDTWYIRYKYSSFKQEITCNIIHQLSMEQFNDWLAASADHLSSDHCRGIKYLGAIIGVQHLLSIMIYCGADELQRSLTQTYRKCNEAESDNELIHRHSEYAYWAQLLYETANNFGIKVKNGPYGKFYHGMDHEMTFASTIAYFHGPLSTSSEYEVALVFALANQKDNGLIIELRNLDALHASYFDCAWISEYGYESEKFFIGGDFGLIIKNIIAPISARNYEIYVECLNIIQQMMKGNTYETNYCAPLGRHIKKCVHKLLQHELSLSDPGSYARFNKLPLYIAKTLHYYCLNVFEISIDWRSLHEMNENTVHKGYGFIKDMLVSASFNRSFLDLNVLSLLFPHLNKIIVCNITLCRDAMEAISQYCQINNNNNNNSQVEDDEEKMNYKNNKSLKLKEIIIYRPTKTNIQQTIDAAIEDYADEFAKYGWKLYKKAKFELVIAQM